MRTINEWAEGFAKLYEVPDKYRTPEEIWLGAMKHCTAIGEAIRKTDYDELMKEAAHAFCWILSFVKKCNGGNDTIFYCKPGLNEMVYLKYPHRCGRCHGIPCTCDAKKQDEIKDKATRFREAYQELKSENLEKYTIDRWLLDFEKIYGVQNYLQRMDDIGFHFLEEVGEEATAVCKLVQLKGVIDGETPIEGVNAEFLKYLGDLGKLIDYYDNIPKDDEKKPKLIFNSREPEVVKNRVVEAKAEMISELADTFSWFCGILTKLKYFEKKYRGNYDLEERLQAEYDCREGACIKCPTCRKPKCECVFFPTK